MHRNSQRITRRVMSRHLGRALVVSTFMCFLLMSLCLFQGDGGWSWRFFSVLCAVFFPVLVARELGEGVRMHSLGPMESGGAVARGVVIAQLVRWLGGVALLTTLVIVGPVSYLPERDLRFTLVMMGMHLALYCAMTVDQVVSLSKSLRNASPTPKARQE